jgi:hypothetical protein
MDRTSAADQSPQIMPDRGRAFGGRTAAGALAPEREHRIGSTASSLKMTPTPPIALELIEQARGPVYARLPGLSAPCPFAR